MYLMIVEDKKFIRDGIFFLLSEMPELTQIKMAKNGAEAWQIIMEDRYFPDILLTDIRMPVVDGLDLSTRVRAHSSLTKIIFISGYEEFGYAKKAIELGASGYVTKPIAQEELLTLLHQVIQQIIMEKNKNRQEEMDWFCKNESKEFLKKMLLLMQEKPGEASLKRFAEEAGVSAAAVSQFFKEKTGCYFKDYLLDCKMKQAKKMLAAGGYGEQLCLALGYSDYDYFSKSFKKYYGKSPSEYRNKDIDTLK